MVDLSALHPERLRILLLHSREVLTSTVQTVSDRPEIEKAIWRLMEADDIHAAFLELAETDPDIMRMVLQSTVCALFNARSAAAIEAELKRRAVSRN